MESTQAERLFCVLLSGNAKHIEACPAETVQQAFSTYRIFFNQKQDGGSQWAYLPFNLASGARVVENMALLLCCMILL
jgi:hypothetical protein